MAKDSPGPGRRRPVKARMTGPGGSGSEEEVEYLFKCRSMAAGVGYAVLLCGLAVGAFWLGAQTDTALGVGSAVAVAEEGMPAVADRANTIDGNTVGEVLINGQVVIRMRTSAGGFTAPERAMIIAQRIQDWVAGQYSPYDLAVREGAYDGAELRAAGDLIVDVNPAEASALGSTSMGLAEAWKANIQIALGVEPAPAVGTQIVGDGGTGTSATGGTTPPPPPVRYDDKIVPILSVGGSTAIGMARVNGPEDMVRNVVACTQLELTFRKVLEIDVYVPVTTKGGLDRVQEVGVTGLLDIEI